MKTKGNIIPIEISSAMKKNYLEYAMSVITERALPDVRDGLKPVHRRILYSMYDLGITPDKKYRKCARIVGDVLGKYHPHGDSSVYDALVRLAQDFNLRYTLVDGHGNFGSVDGDSAAAYRYTEARLQKIALEMVKDINKDTVDFVPNFDGEEKEPLLLPSRFPNLLVNGSEGIAVGFATSIPPHNLGEVIDGINYLIDNPKCSINDLIKFIKAPDFPTGGQIINPNEILDIYTNGTGNFQIRAKYHIENNNKINSIIFTEIPYQVNKSKLLERLYEISKDTKKTFKNKKTNKIEEIIIKAKINTINDITDESDRNGMRINITLKLNADINKTLALLFKESNLQCNYNSNFTAIYGTNKLLEHINLKDILNYYIDFQKEILTRRTQFELNKATTKAHILEGLIIALDNIDNVIKLIKSSKSIQEAKQGLINKFSFSDKQAQVILDMKLQRLTNLEIDKIKTEQQNIIKTIEHLQNILNNNIEISNVLKNELLDIKKEYGDTRKTEIVYENAIQDIEPEQFIEDYNVHLTLTKDNYFKKTQSTSLRGSASQKLKDNDIVITELDSTNKSDVLFFTNKFNCYKKHLSEFDDKKLSTLGDYLVNDLQLENNEKIEFMIATTKYKEYLIICFGNGKIAKVPLSSYFTKQNRSMLKNAINNNSKIINMFTIEKDIDILLKSSLNKVLITNTSIINSKGSKNTQGVSIMKSKNNSTVIMAELLDDINTDKIESIEFYKNSTGKGVGIYQKKNDIIELK